MFGIASAIFIAKLTVDKFTYRCIELKLKCAKCVLFG